MRILDRYTLTTFFMPWVCITLGFAALFVLVDLIEGIGDFLDGGASIFGIAGYYLRFLTSVWGYLSPITLLLGLLFALYQLTRHNEIIAMRASGISVYRILAPFLILGTFFSLLTMWNNANIAPKNIQWTQQYLAQMRSPDASVLTHVRFRDPENRRSWMIDSLNVETGEIQEVTVIQQRRDADTILHLISAERGEWLDTHWAFFEVSIQPHSEAGYPMGRPERDEVRLMRELTESPERIMRETMEFEFMTNAEIREFLATREVSDRTRADLLTRIHMRRGQSWLCLVSIMLAVPFSTQTARKGAFAGIFLCLLLLFSLYFTMNLFQALGQGGHVPPWLGGWFPTLAFGAFGLWLLRKLR